VKLGIVLNPHKHLGRLTTIFTGCSATHTVWVDEGRGLMWDMHLIRRRRIWPHYNPPTEVRFFEFPEVTFEYLEDRLSRDNSTYGLRDCAMFALRPFYKFLGKSPRNAGGVICSEMCNNDIWACGGRTPWIPGEAPPSPCDLLRWLTHHQSAVT
jgi:hypothetical protein